MVVAKKAQSKSTKTIARRRADKAFESLKATNPTSAGMLSRHNAFDVVQRFRTLAPKAIDTLQKMLADTATPARERVRIAEMILDRAYGKPLKTTLRAVVSGIPEGEVLEREALRILQQRGALPPPGYTLDAGRGEGGSEPGPPDKKPKQLPKPRKSKK